MIKEAKGAPTWASKLSIPIIEFTTQKHKILTTPKYYKLQTSQTNSDRNNAKTKQESKKNYQPVIQEAKGAQLGPASLALQ